MSHLFVGDPLTGFQMMAQSPVWICSHSHWNKQTYELRAPRFKFMETSQFCLCPDPVILRFADKSTQFLYRLWRPLSVGIFMGVTEALKVQRINAQVCTYKHFLYSVKEVLTVLRYLRKQKKRVQNTKGDQEDPVS